MTHNDYGLGWNYPPRMPVANEGLGWDPLLKMVHNPGGDCYWEGGQPKLWNLFLFIFFEVGVSHLSRIITSPEKQSVNPIITGDPVA